jgi:hypothetical protein
MSPSVTEAVLQAPRADRMRVLMELAKSLLAESSSPMPLPLVEGDAPPIGYLFRIPPMPEPGSEEDEAAEDARRMASLDDAVTAEEMIALLDFHAAAVEPGRP